MTKSSIHTTTIQETDGSLHMDYPSSMKLNNMISGLLKGKTLQEIIDFSYRLLGNPPLLVAGSTLIASPPDCTFANATFLDMLRRTSPGSREPIFLLTEKEFKEKQRRSDAPLLVDCKHLGLRLIVAKITYDDTIVASLQLPESEQSFGEQDVLFIHILAKFISSELSGSSMSNQFSDMLFRTRFSALLEGNDPQSDLSWVHLLQEKESRTLCVCVLRLSASGAQPSIAQLGGDLYFCKGVPFHDEVVFLCTVNGDQQREAIRTHFSSVVREYNGVVGISEEFTDGERVLPHYRQAKITMEALLTLHGPGQVYDYSRYSMEVILFDASFRVQIKRYYEPVYTLLTESDQKKGTSLCQTLEEYLAYNGDKDAVCQHLGLHRNTLAFRLHCIEALLDWNVSEGTSFYRLKIMEQLRKNQELIERIGEQWNTKSSPLAFFLPNN